MTSANHDLKVQLGNLKSSYTKKELKDIITANQNKKDENLPAIIKVVILFTKGLPVPLLRMAIDLTKGMYVYHEQAPFILSTTHEIHAHMDTSMESMHSIKQSIMDSLAKPKDVENGTIWNMYKDCARPKTSVCR
ncbi:hypothetical protein RMATCC62417_07220 [Rhizopus microsporus]|nr:hypothetical protein RMATCC62417_07220 [Rhizopus microsporus]